MSEAIKSVSDDTFKAEVLDAQQPVLVDFWAPWCHPCKMIAPILDQAAADLGQRVKIVKVNVDDNPQTAAQYGIRSIPNLILFKNGVEAGRKVGAPSHSQLLEFLNQHC